MSRYELQKLYRKICKKSPEVYGNEDLWMENMADADYVYLMVRAFDVIDLNYYGFELETLNPFVWPLVVAGSETIGYTISASCTWVDADCYTHDGTAELTFSATEVHDMTPEEL